jgi:metal-sulfur cluster biosynthetic enzyme
MNEQKEKILNELKYVADPELGINIVDLGLVYDVLIDKDANVTLNMTLTSPVCPLSRQIEEEAVVRLLNLDFVLSVKVKWVFDPPWDKSLATPKGQALLITFGYM